MTPENFKPIFLHYGRHTIRACRLPDGRVFPDFREALRVLCLIVGASPAVMERMPETDCPNACAPAFGILLEATQDRPETKAFKLWLDEKMFGNGERGWDEQTLVNVFRYFGQDMSREQILQALMESPENRVVDDGNTVRIYKRDTGELLAEKRNCVEN